MTSHGIRRMLGNLTQAKFAYKYDIPLATVKNWDSRDCMPKYIETLILRSIADENMRMYQQYNILPKNL